MTRIGDQKLCPVLANWDFPNLLSCCAYQAVNFSNFIHFIFDGSLLFGPTLKHCLGPQWVCSISNFFLGMGCYLAISAKTWLHRFLNNILIFDWESIFMQFLWPKILKKIWTDMKKFTLKKSPLPANIAAKNTIPLEIRRDMNGLFIQVNSHFFKTESALCTFPNFRNPKPSFLGVLQNYCLLWYQIHILAILGTWTKL